MSHLQSIYRSFVCASIATAFTAALAWMVIDSTTTGLKYYDDSAQSSYQGGAL